MESEPAATTTVSNMSTALQFQIMIYTFIFFFLCISLTNDILLLVLCVRTIRPGLVSFAYLKVCAANQGAKVFSRQVERLRENHRVHTRSPPNRSRRCLSHPQHLKGCLSRRLLLRSPPKWKPKGSPRANLWKQQRKRNQRLLQRKQSQRESRPKTLWASSSVLRYFHRSVCSLWSEHCDS